MFKTRLSSLPKEVEQMLPLNVALIRDFYFMKSGERTKEKGTQLQAEDNSPTT